MMWIALDCTWIASGSQPQHPNAQQRTRRTPPHEATECAATPPLDAPAPNQSTTRSSLNQTGASWCLDLAGRCGRKPPEHQSPGGLRTVSLIELDSCFELVHQGSSQKETQDSSKERKCGFFARGKPRFFKRKKMHEGKILELWLQQTGLLRSAVCCLGVAF